MAFVKGPNGQVIDVLGAVASGLVGGGHAVYVDASGEPSDGPVEADDEVADAADDAKDAKAVKG